MDWPPILPKIEDELKFYLLHPENLPVHRYENNQQIWPWVMNPKQLLHFENSPLSTTLKVHRDASTGEIIEFREVPVEVTGANPKNSMSLNRAPAPPSEATRGNALYIPFWPGSFPEPEKSKSKQTSIDTELLTVPPGFDRGVLFAEDGRTVLQNPDVYKKINIETNLIKTVDLSQLIKTTTINENDVTDNKEKETVPKPNIELLPEEDEVIPKEPLVLKISESKPIMAMKQLEWAVLLDATKPVMDFNEKIPEMAMEFPFELDPFQKLAILQLEQRNHIFVAAHTSAGKTVVAEYAIALSQRHRTRSIYTSPIKALSNQKYRDFKKRFDDVGLITGDFQINQKASCLIMTTEILRSMLYCGSDITRDLEYVIFDEVHYINDRERGHVWEQVLIMLPKHVCVVLLSATVPNTMEFADWLGRTHQRKVYVVTTFKRPVPLQHYLYTGKGGSSKNNRFKILDANSWIPSGYMKAVESVEVTNPKTTFYQKKTGPPTASQDKTLFTTLVGYLQKNDLLPVVVFTFSRAKCDNNASSLGHLDLTTKEEKGHITQFFNKCIRGLKKPDQEIPQIVKMRDILTRGIGVHHSGILPIIKETVEMLFQDGYTKLLFATETFAMGVNMPAKTVIFDSIRKHDGKELRHLEPAEYIQMAGRAGRRGLDNEGTVIILCKQDVPPEETLKKMMLGKPSMLVSQFRLTYGMVLSVLRTESLSVEGIMSRSFGEADHQKNMIQLSKKLEEVDKRIAKLGQIENEHLNLIEFYESASAYLEHRKETMMLVMQTLKVQKMLTPGRIVLIHHKTHLNKLAVILSTIRGKQLQYKVLILSEGSSASSKEDLWYYMMGIIKERLYLPYDPSSHEIITILAVEIFEITSITLQIDAELIVRDFEKRQMERFRDAPPGQKCMDAVRKLYELSADNGKSIKYLHLISDVKVNEQHLYYKLKTMYDLWENVKSHMGCTKVDGFEDKFVILFDKKFLEEKKKNLEFLMSNASLALYHDYQNRIELLRKFRYVDSQNRVETKGRVACEMGTNELLITEMILINVFFKLEPSEVAALLSSLVYKGKMRNDAVHDLENLPSSLKKAIKEMKEIHEKIGTEERKLQIQTDEFIEDLNFELVNVVYEWATNKPFAEIMELTDIQEGIIVRCIQQLNEIICNIKIAANIVGDPNLAKKMEEASNCIKRDIVFAASLYTQDDK